MDAQGVLVGIGTDGFRWVLWVKDIKAGDLYKNVARESIRSPVRKVMATRFLEETPEQETHRTRIRTREELKQRLIMPFSLENLPVQVADTIDRITV
jgi:hypothetical protein